MTAVQQRDVNTLLAYAKARATRGSGATPASRAADKTLRRLAGPARAAALRETMRALVAAKPVVGKYSWNPQTISINRLYHRMRDAKEDVRADAELLQILRDTAASAQDSDLRNFTTQLLVDLEDHEAMKTIGEKLDDDVAMTAFVKTHGPDALVKKLKLARGRGVSSETWSHAASALRSTPEGFRRLLDFHAAAKGKVREILAEALQDRERWAEILAGERAADIELALSLIQEIDSIVFTNCVEGALGAVRSQARVRQIIDTVIRWPSTPRLVAWLTDTHGAPKLATMFVAARRKLTTEERRVADKSIAFYLWSSKTKGWTALAKAILDEPGCELSNESLKALRKHAR